MKFKHQPNQFRVIYEILKITLNGIANSHNYIHINVPLIIKTFYIVLNVLRTSKMTTDYGVHLL